MRATRKMATKTKLGVISVDGIYPSSEVSPSQKFIRASLWTSSFSRQSLERALRSVLAFCFTVYPESANGMYARSLRARGLQTDFAPQRGCGIYVRKTFNNQQWVFKYYSSASIRDPTMYEHSQLDVQTLQIPLSDLRPITVLCYPFVPGSHNASNSAQFAPILRNLAAMHQVSISRSLHVPNARTSSSKCDGQRASYLQSSSRWIDWSLPMQMLEEPGTRLPL